MAFFERTFKIFTIPPSFLCWSPSNDNHVGPQRNLSSKKVNFYLKLCLTATLKLAMVLKMLTKIMFRNLEKYVSRFMLKFVLKKHPLNSGLQLKNLPKIWKFSAYPLKSGSINGKLMSNQILIYVLMALCKLRVCNSVTLKFVEVKSSKHRIWTTSCP